MGIQNISSNFVHQEISKHDTNSGNVVVIHYSDKLSFKLLRRKIKQYCEGVHIINTEDQFINFFSSTKEQTSKKKGKNSQYVLYKPTRWKAWDDFAETKLCDDKKQFFLFDNSNQAAFNADVVWHINANLQVTGIRSNECFL